MKWCSPNPPTDWHRWFAWRPVFADYDGGEALVWLEVVERKYAPPSFSMFHLWDYRLVNDHDG